MIDRKTIASCCLDVRQKVPWVRKGVFGEAGKSMFAQPGVSSLERSAGENKTSTGTREQGHARSSWNRDMGEEMFSTCFQGLKYVDAILLDPPQEDGFPDRRDQTLHSRQSEAPC